MCVNPAGEVRFPGIYSTKKLIVMSSSTSSNPLLIILSVLIPIVGIVLYFVKKDEAPEAAKTYLWAAAGGFVVGLILVL